MKQITIKELKEKPIAKINPTLFVKTTSKPQISTKKAPNGLRWIMNHLKQNNVLFSQELRFDKVRRFRFDLALEQYKVGIEYEGLMSEKSRHTNVSGYTKDCEKYNLAQSLGWKVYRYTALNYKEFANDLKKIRNDLG